MHIEAYGTKSVNMKAFHFCFFSSHIFSRSFVNMSKCQKIFYYDWICSQATSNIIFRSMLLEPLRLKNHLENTAWGSSDGNLTMRFSSSLVTATDLILRYARYLSLWKQEKKLFWKLGHINRELSNSIMISLELLDIPKSKIFTSQRKDQSLLKHFRIWICLAFQLACNWIQQIRHFGSNLPSL